MATTTIAQLTARDTLNTIALALVEPHNPIPVISILAQSLEAAREFLPSELHSPVNAILDGCAQAERCN